MSNSLSFEKLMNAIASVFDSQDDPRQQGKVRYKLSDAALAAFSVFFMQSPSFLAHQRTMLTNKGKSNAQTLFTMEKLPSDAQIRNMLDPLRPEDSFVLFRHAYRELDNAGVLERYREGLPGLLVSFDGTDYFSSETICCPNCTRYVLKNGKTQYRHSVVLPVIVAPEQAEVISLEPAFVVPQDGEEKQDCEINAAKRWLEGQARYYNLEGAIALGDDLYCHEPWCRVLLAHGLHFVLVCKPDSHKTLYEFLALHPPQEHSVRRYNGCHSERYDYRYANGLPLKDDKDALLVNLCEFTLSREDTGEVLYRNSFATDLPLRADTVEEVVRCGRCRWKSENENNNALKTKGYNFEHNYGHGQQHLSSVLLTLLLFAFLCHTIFALTLPVYRQLRKALGTRKTFFDDIRALTRYALFTSWLALLHFMLEGLELTPDSS